MFGSSAPETCDTGCTSGSRSGRSPEWRRCRAIAGLSRGHRAGQGPQRQPPGAPLAREGQGEFAAVPTTYDLESGDLRALIAAPGELVLAVDVVAGSGSEPTPAALELAPASPNPFSRSTVLRYRLARSGPVDLRVFDAAGRQVAVLIDAERPAGIHEVTLEGSHLGSGVYFCRLESGDRIETTKVVLRQ